MDSKIKKQWIKAGILFALFVCMVSWGGIVSYKSHKAIDADPVYTDGAVVDIHDYLLTRHDLKVEFMVDGKVYKASRDYNPHLQTINIGDTCKIVYQRTNPGNNRMLSLDGRRLIHIRPQK
jgi:hypothetical protein